jgi:hypothetical protein
MFGILGAFAVWAMAIFGCLVAVVAGVIVMKLMGLLD